MREIKVVENPDEATIFYHLGWTVKVIKMRRKTHTLACGMKAAFET